MHARLAHFMLTEGLPLASGKGPREKALQYLTEQSPGEVQYAPGQVWGRTQEVTLAMYLSHESKREA